ncbi:MULTISPECIES: CATRA system-associated protein [unclassified Streptomyces]|uniref:CATRA system-associated protein n=1 Tax=unclassified Streptomyces TaxID=2593676 RepID=UPI0033B66EF9
MAVLDAVLAWRLPPDSWEEVDERIAVLTKAVGEGDTVLVGEVTAELETNGRRVGRMGPHGTTAPDGKQQSPPRVRERVVALIHTLDPASKPAGGGGQAPPAGNGKA